jgi:hypothetical protein
MAGNGDVSSSIAYLRAALNGFAPTLRTRAARASWAGFQPGAEKKIDLAGCLGYRFRA